MCSARQHLQDKAPARDPSAVRLLKLETMARRKPRASAFQPFPTLRPVLGFVIYVHGLPHEMLLVLALVDAGRCYVTQNPTKQSVFETER